MSEYQMLRTYLEVLFGNVIHRALRDERGRHGRGDRHHGCQPARARRRWPSSCGASSRAAPRTSTSRRRPPPSAARTRNRRCCVAYCVIERGTAATILLFPVFAVVTFMFIQALMWQHERQMAASVADRAASAVALYGSSPDSAQADALADLRRPDCEM